MPRVLIAGCGYVGEATADLFQERGWEVEGWTLSEASAIALQSKRYRVSAHDISNPDAVGAGSARYDVVVHCASSGGGGAEDYRRTYFRGAENLLGAFPDATLIFTSSTSVYAQRAGEWVTEESMAEPDRETAKILRETEELILAHRGIVARLAGIYGPCRSFMLRNFLAGNAVMPPEDRFVNQVHRDDIAKALFLLSENRNKIGAESGARIFNVVDDEPMLSRSCYQWLAAHFGRSAPPVADSDTPRKRGNSNKRVSNAKLRALGWTLRYPRFEIGMSESVIPAWKT